MKPIELTEFADDPYHSTVNLRTGKVDKVQDRGENAEEDGTCIVKVQLPLESNHERPPSMVYDKDRKISVMVETTADLRIAMKHKIKMFFKADVSEFNKTRKLKLIERVQMQDW